MKKYGTEYKHVFKKDKNDNYYWVSSEPVKQKSITTLFYLQKSSIYPYIIYKYRIYAYLYPN